MLDENPEIRKILWNFLVQRHDKAAEEALLNYMGQICLKYNQREQLHLLYALLGHCGSPDSLQFIQKRLFSSPWNFSRLRSTHRVGAASALMNMNREESRKVLEKAGKSIWPSIRISFRKAMELNNAKQNNPA